MVVNATWFHRTASGVLDRILCSGTAHLWDVAARAAAKPRPVHCTGPGFVHHRSMPRRTVPQLCRSCAVDATLSEPGKNLFNLRFHRESCAAILLETHLQARGGQGSSASKELTARNFFCVLCRPARIFLNM